MKKVIEYILILLAVIAGAFVIYVTIKTPFGGNSAEVDKTGDGSKIIINQSN